MVAILWQSYYAEHYSLDQSESEKGIFSLGLGV